MAEKRWMSAERRFDLALLAAWAAADAKDDAERDRLFRDAEGHLDWGFMAALRVDRDTGDAAPTGRIARLRGLLDDARFRFFSPAAGGSRADRRVR